MGCRPRGVLSSRELQSVLYDLHRTEAIIQAIGYNYGHDEEVGKYYYVVLAKHGITQAQFDSSMVWYIDHPQRIHHIYHPLFERCEAEAEAWAYALAVGLPKLERELPNIDETQIEMIYGLQPWSNEWWTWKNAEKCKKVTEKFAYVEIK